MARRTKLEAEQTRQRILDAAEELFFERGVGRTALEDIATAANVTRGAVYWHFRNKAELFQALHERIRLPQEEVVARAVAERHPDPLSVVEQTMIDALALIAGDPRRLRTISILMYRCEYVEELQEALDRQCAADEQMRCTLAAAFELARTNGSLDEAWQPQTAAEALKNLLSGLLANYLRSPGDRDLVGEGRASLRPLFRSFRTAAERHPPEAPPQRSAAE